MPDFFNFARELPHAITDKLRRASELVSRGEAVVEELVRVVADVRKTAHDFASRPADPTFVYVLPPSTPMMVQMARLEPRERSARAAAERQALPARETLSFIAHHPIEAGSWVVVAGPATVRAVVLGNQLQTAIHDPQGQVCKITETWLPGVLLRVELEAT